MTTSPRRDLDHPAVDEGNERLLGDQLLGLFLLFARHPVLPAVVEDPEDVLDQNLGTGSPPVIEASFAGRPAVRSEHGVRLDRGADPVGDHELLEVAGERLTSCSIQSATRINVCGRTIGTRTRIRSGELDAHDAVGKRRRWYMALAAGGSCDGGHFALRREGRRLLWHLEIVSHAQGLRHPGDKVIAEVDRELAALADRQVIVPSRLRPKKGASLAARPLSCRTVLALQHCTATAKMRPYYGAAGRNTVTTATPSPTPSL